MYKALVNKLYMLTLSISSIISLRHVFLILIIIQSLRYIGLGVWLGW